MQPERRVTVEMVTIINQMTKSQGSVIVFISTCANLSVRVIFKGPESDFYKTDSTVCIYVHEWILCLSYGLRNFMGDRER